MTSPELLQAAARGLVFDPSLDRPHRGREARYCLRRKIPAFVFVNNRLEGHAPSTIEAVADMIER